MKPWVYILLFGAAAAGYRWYQVNKKEPCDRCLSLVEQGRFQQVVDDFPTEVCDVCVTVAVEDSLILIDRLMDQYEDPGLSSEARAEAGQEIKSFWHNLFQMSVRSRKKHLMDHYLINLIAEKDPIVVRYQALRKEMDDVQASG